MKKLVFLLVLCYLSFASTFVIGENYKVIKFESYFYKDREYFCYFLKNKNGEIFCLYNLNKVFFRDNQEIEKGTVIKNTSDVGFEKVEGI